MPITSPAIENSEIISDFDAKLRAFVSASTNWIGTTVVWNTNVATVTGVNTPNTDPGSPAATTILPDVAANTTQANSLRSVFLQWMAIYSRTQRISLTNTGNLNPRSYLGVYRFTTSAYDVAVVTSDATARFATRDVQVGSLIENSNLENLISDFQSIWITRCRDTTIRNFNYYYCHSSCHSSRSRR